MQEKKTGLSFVQKRLIRLFCGRRPTLYFPELCLVFGWQLGLLLSRLAYWHGKGKDKDGWIYKTAEDLRKETGLSFANQKTAIRNGLEAGLLELTYRKVPRRRHYRVDWTKAAEIVELRAPMYGLVVSKQLMELIQIEPTTTKSTQKTTAKNTYSRLSIKQTLKDRLEKFRKDSSNGN